MIGWIGSSVRSVVWVTALVWPGAGLADCFERLAQGAEAQRLGRLDEAEAIFASALADEACRAPPVGPLLQFSLGRTLLSHGDPARACDGLAAFTAAATAPDPDVVDAARAAIAEAEAACTPPAEPPEPPVSQAPTPPAVESPPAAAVVPTPERFAVGLRIEAGLSGLASGGLRRGTLSPGPALGLGLALVHRATPRWRLLLEPGLTFDSLRYTVEWNGRARAVVWRRVVAEATGAVEWHPDGGPWGVLVGVRGGRVLDATEAPTVFSAAGEDIALADWLLDGVVGAAWDGSLGPARLRSSLTAGLGLLRLNLDTDPAPWHGFRFVVGVAALF